MRVNLKFTLNTSTDQLWHANNYKQFLKRTDGGKIPSITPTGIPGFMAGYDELENDVENIEWTTENGDKN